MPTSPAPLTETPDGAAPGAAIPATPPPAAPPDVDTTAPPPAAVALFKEGLGFLRDADAGSQDFGLAAARLLDAADLRHPGALFFCALLYYCGVGVSRNTTTAADYAGQYLEQQSSGIFAEACKALRDGSLGTENARNLLFQKPAVGVAPAPGADAPGRKRGKSALLWLAVAIPVLAIGVLAAIHFSKTASSDLDNAGDLKLGQLLSPSEVEQATRDAMALAARVQAEADAEQQSRATAEQVRVATELARTKAEEERREREAIAEQERQRAQETARAEREETERRAEAQRQRDAEARQAAAQARQSQQAQQQSQQQSQQLQSTLNAAREAIRQGQLDRASGLLDAVLASSPENGEAQALKQQVRQMRARAIQNLQIR